MSGFVKFGRLVLSCTAAVLCLLMCITAFFGCAYGGEQNEKGEKTDFLKAELDGIKRYIEVGQYKELDIEAGEGPKHEALWTAVTKNFKIKEYPAEQVWYYRDQTVAEYKYYAEKAGISYEEMCRELGVDDGSILEQAKALTKSDLVYAAIVKLEGISITQEEKTRLFDKYVEKYVETYGYNADYVKANMADEIYGSMLYDKTTEFLLNNNNVK